MKINEKVKTLIRDWLNVQEMSINNSIVIHETDSHHINLAKQEIWYRGDPNELQQFYRQYDDGLRKTNFWAGQSSTGVNFRKIHTGLPSLIVDKLVDIVVDDMNAIKLTEQVNGKEQADVKAQERWNAIEKEHGDFKESILKEAVKWAILGDSAFKINYDAEISQYPIIEVIKAKNIDYEMKRGRLIGLNFMFPRRIDKKNHVLVERYTSNGVEYILYDDQGKDVTISDIEDLEDLYPFVYDEKMIMAVPLRILSSTKYEGRGRSLLESKEGAFDSLDEAWSQWIEALRDGKTRTYIPEDLIPRDPLTGQLLQPSTFDRRFIGTGSSKGEDAQSRIQTDAPEIHADQYLQTYITALDLCLQGLISPSTLGIDVKKLDNAEAQREKEKTTLYTRSKIVQKLERVIPQLVETVLKVDDLLNGQTPGQYTVSVDFGEYANPSFEAVVETVGKAKAQGIMSLEQAVEELYGDSWTDDEKKAEVLRIKLEQGYDVEQPGVDTSIANQFDLDNKNDEDLEDGQEE